MVFLNSVLNVIPIFLSFLKMHVMVWKNITKIQKRFLWGGIKVDYKISWFKSHDVCKLECKGCLGLDSPISVCRSVRDAFKRWKGFSFPIITLLVENNVFSWAYKGWSLYLVCRSMVLLRKWNEVFKLLFRDSWAKKFLLRLSFLEFLPHLTIRGDY